MNLQEQRRAQLMADLEQKAIRARAREQSHLLKLRAKAQEEEREAFFATEQGAKVRELLAWIWNSPTSTWPGRIAACDWLLERAPEFRTRAWLILADSYNRRLEQEGGDPLNDPLPGEPQSPYQEIRDLLTARPAVPAPTPTTSSPKGTKPMISLTLNISTTADLANARILMAGIFDATPAATPPAAAPVTDIGAERTKRSSKKATEDTKSAPAAEEQKAEPEAATAEPATGAQQSEAAAGDSEFAELLSTDTAEAAPALKPEDVLAKLQQFAKDKGPLKLRDLLQTFGAAKFGDLKPEQYADVLKAAA